VSGYVFKLVRESANRTQQQLAADLRVSAATIQSWESGRRPLMAMPAGQFLALRSRLSRLGAAPTLLAALTLALEADHILAQALATPHHQADPGEHPLGSWVLSRPLTTMTAWPLGGKTPDVLSGIQPAVGRRGPVPAGPALSADERRHVIGHLQAVAERASRHDPDGLLLRSQAYYLTGFDQAPGTRAMACGHAQGRPESAALIQGLVGDMAAGTVDRKRAYPRRGSRAHAAVHPRSAQRRQRADG
jgi:transcriptional regulator with XRE-family HTH domain